MLLSPPPHHRHPASRGGLRPRVTGGAGAAEGAAAGAAGRGSPRAAPGPPSFREPPLSFPPPAPLRPGAEETGRGRGGGRVAWGEGLFLGAGRSLRAEPLPGRDEAVRGACGDGEAAALLCVAVAAGQLILILGGL